jgi:hypothetical protein
MNRIEKVQVPGYDPVDGDEVNFSANGEFAYIHCGARQILLNESECLGLIALLLRALNEDAP